MYIIYIIYNIVVVVELSVSVISDTSHTLYARGIDASTTTTTEQYNV